MARIAWSVCWDGADRVVGLLEGVSPLLRLLHHGFGDLLHLLALLDKVLGGFEGGLHLVDALLRGVGGVLCALRHFLGSPVYLLDLLHADVEQFRGAGSPLLHFVGCLTQLGDRAAVLLDLLCECEHALGDLRDTFAHLSRPLTGILQTGTDLPNCLHRFLVRLLEGADRFTQGCNGLVELAHYTV